MIKLQGEFSYTYHPEESATAIIHKVSVTVSCKEPAWMTLFVLPQDLPRLEASLQAIEFLVLPNLVEEDKSTCIVISGLDNIKSALNRLKEHLLITALFYDSMVSKFPRPFGSFGDLYGDPSLSKIESLLQNGFSANPPPLPTVIMAPRYNPPRELNELLPRSSVHDFAPGVITVISESEFTMRKRSNVQWCVQGYGSEQPKYTKKTYVVNNDDDDDDDERIREESMTADEIAEFSLLIADRVLTLPYRPFEYSARMQNQ